MRLKRFYHLHHLNKVGCKITPSERMLSEASLECARMFAVPFVSYHQYPKLMALPVSTYLHDISNKRTHDKARGIPVVNCNSLFVGVCCLLTFKKSVVHYILQLAQSPPDGVIRNVFSILVSWWQLKMKIAAIPPTLSVIGPSRDTCTRQELNTWSVCSESARSLLGVCSESWWRLGSDLTDEEEAIHSRQTGSD